MKRFLLTGAAVTAIAAAPLTGVALTSTSTLADPPCVNGDGVACVDVPGAGATAGNGAAGANVPGAGASADGGGASAFVPGANSYAGPNGAGFCVNGWCANAG